MKQVLNTYTEVVALVDSLAKENKWYVDVTGNDIDGYTVQWIERKTYVAQDGRTYQDEVWITEAGELLCIQDVSADHVRNILRMIIRRERELTAATQELIETLLQATEQNNSLPKTLH